MKIHLMAFADRIRASLFVLPTACMVSAAALGLASIHLDGRLGDAANDLPLGVASTVDSARAVLSTVAGATMTVAGIAFSVALLVIQLASSQYSPRVVHGLFRDPFNKRVMGVVVGTFTFCLVVLRSVRSALEDGGDAVVPNVSVAVAVLLGLASVMAIVAFINHNAHTMDISEIFERVTTESVQRLRETWPEHGSEQAVLDAATSNATTVPQWTISAAERGWVQYINHDQLLSALPAGATLQLEVGIGRYVIPGAPLATVWLASQSTDELRARISAGLRLGRTRTMAQDPAYGVRQLVDIGLRALSPGVNDPTTAHDALVHLGAVLAESYRRAAPAKRREGADGRVVLDPHAHDHRSLTELAFSELRRAARTDPAIIAVIFAVIGTIAQVKSAPDHPAAGELREQAGAALEGALASDILGSDRRSLREAYERLLYGGFGDRNSTARQLSLQHELPGVGIDEPGRGAELGSLA